MDSFMDSSRDAGKSDYSAQLQRWLQRHRRTHPKEIELGLQRVRAVAERMQLLKPEQPVITVAGTNGKGSTVTLLEAILRAAGYTTASYTSPHMHRYNERIRINNQCVSDAELCHAFEFMEAQRGSTSLSFFEFSTLAALHCFKSKRPDVLLLETGLGGRLDAVNIIDADLAIITSIGIDHTEWLGTTRESIGREKAGITRRGVACICGDRQPPQSIRVLKKDRPLYLIGDDFSYHKDGDHWRFTSADLCLDELPLPALFGDIQLQNASCALMALQCLAKHFTVSAAAIKHGLRSAFLPGRFQIKRHKSAASSITSIFDISHNPQGVEVMVQNLKSLANGKALHAVFAILATKDAESVAKIVAPLVDHWYLAEPNSKHALPLAQLAAIIKKHKKNSNSVQCFASVATAYENALHTIQTNHCLEDHILVFGSTMTVAEALKSHGDRQPT